MRGSTGHNGISRALLALVILSSCLVVLSVLLGCRLWAFRRDLVTAEETNLVLQEQLAMAADTLTQVSGRLTALRTEMEAAPVLQEHSLQAVARSLSGPAADGAGLSASERRALLRLVHAFLEQRNLSDARGVDRDDTSTAALRAPMFARRERLEKVLLSEPEAVLTAMARHLGCSREEAELVAQLLAEGVAKGGPGPEGPEVRPGEATP